MEVKMNQILVCQTTGNRRVQKKKLLHLLVLLVLPVCQFLCRPTVQHVTML